MSLSTWEWLKEIASPRRKKTAPEENMKPRSAPWRQQAGFPGLKADLLPPVLRARAG